MGDIAQVYEDNGGSMVLYLGPNYVAAAAGSRLFHEDMVMQRENRNLVEVVPGLYAMHTICEVSWARFLNQLIPEFEKYNRVVGVYPDIQQIHHLITNKLWLNRLNLMTLNYCCFFGRDADGVWRAFGYEPAGSYNEVTPLGYFAQGGERRSLNTLMRLKFIGKSLNKAEAVEGLKNVMLASSTTEATLGDYAYIWIVDEDGIHEDRVELAKD